MIDQTRPAERAIEYDVFLSYNWRDQSSVESLARSLQERGLSVFLDRWYLTAGRPWPEILEDALNDCRAVAVILGPHGMGNWQQHEKGVALERQMREPEFPVIPVLLPSADPALGFLSMNTWVDLRAGINDPLMIGALVEAIGGRPPGPDIQERVAATLASVSPYRGLNPFREEDASFFFGRDTFVDQLIDVVRNRNFVAVIGPSGSGKSSVVRAGLVPALRRSEDGRRWNVVTLIPGRQPLSALAAALVPLIDPEASEVSRLAEVNRLADLFSEGRISLDDVVQQILRDQPGTDRILIVVDQWEELYTSGLDRSTIERFIDELVGASRSGQSTVVLTMRADFYSQALGYRPLTDHLQNSVVNLGPMQADEIRQAIEEPARLVGLRFETGLVNRILDDLGDEPGSLPLLEFVLTQLWESRRGGELAHEMYETIGGVRGSISYQAEKVFSNLTDDERTLCKRIFVSLCTVGSGVADTRTRARLSELNETSRDLVNELADARLIVASLDETTEEDVIEVAHEALIVNWSRLRGWLDEDREFLLWRGRLRGFADQWRDSNGGQRNSDWRIASG